MSDKEYKFSKIKLDYSDYKGKINLGLCCINTILRKKNIFCSRTCIRKNYTVQKAKYFALQNIMDISKLIEWNEENNIKCLRLSSDIFPRFTDKEVENYTIDFAIPELKKVGDLAKKYNHRILMHPGQYNQVGALSEETFNSTIKDLSHHADILEAMGIDENGVLIVHGGGIYNDKEKTIQRWISQFQKLPDKVKKRLVIENCERQYNVKDVLKISKACNIPVVFDFHHYYCYELLNSKYNNIQDFLKNSDKKNWNIPENELLELMNDIILSWGNRRIVFHISEQGQGRIGHHSDYIEELPDLLYDILEKYNNKYDLKIDLEVEAKMKEQAILKLYQTYKELF